jgi:hypothetical protein
MNAHISASGDPSVGISVTLVVIDTGLVDFSHYDEAREDARKALKECFEEMWGEPVCVEFEDEQKGDSVACDNTTRHEAA